MLSIIEGMSAVAEIFVIFVERPLVALGIITVVGAGIGVYSMFHEPDVMKLQLVDPECKEYTTLPMVPCKGATTQNALLRCRCNSEWVPVTDEAEKQHAIKNRPQGYRID